MGRVSLILLCLGAGLTARLACAFGAPKGIRCQAVFIHDSDRTGLDAYTYMVPKGWSSKSSLHWTKNTYLADFTATSSDHAYVVEQVQPVNMTYVTGNGQVLQGFRVTKATDYLKAMVAGMQRSGKISNARIIEESDEPVPYGPYEQALAKPSMLTGGMREHKFKEAGFLKLEFEINGREARASLGTTVIGTLLTNNMQLGYGATARQYSNETGTYIIGPTLLVLTPTTPSAARLKEIQLIASSGQMTPKFLSYTVKLALSMAQAGLNAARKSQQELINQFRRNSERSMQNFRERMATKDANTREFCNYLLDQRDYRDPNGGGIVTLPTSYTHSWSNGRGDYFLTSDPTFDPHGLGDVRSDWKQLEPTR